MTINEVAALDREFRRHLLEKAVLDTQHELARRQPGGDHYGAKTDRITEQLRVFELQLANL